MEQYKIFYQFGSDSFFIDGNDQCEIPHDSVLISIVPSFDHGIKFIESEKRYNLVFNEEKQLFHHDKPDKKYSNNGYSLIAKNVPNCIIVVFCHKIDKLYLNEKRKISIDWMKELWKFYCQ